jgi:DNA repair exonuclease SbcCD ATPase subunit
LLSLHQGNLRKACIAHVPRNGELERVKTDLSKARTHLKKKQDDLSEKEHQLKRKNILQSRIDQILDSYEDRMSVKDIQEDLDYLREYRSTQESLSAKIESEKEKLEKGELSPSLALMVKKVRRMKLHLDELERDSKAGEALEIEDRSKLSELVEKEKEKQLSFRNSCDRIETLKKEQEDAQNDLETAKADHIRSFKKVREPKVLEMDIQKLKKEIHENNEKRQTHKSSLDQIEHWKHYQKELRSYQNLQKKVEELQSREGKARQYYGSFMTLKEKILEAESLAMLNIIETINTHAQTYLDTFFPNNPISVQMKPFKTTKKSTKPSISVEIEYKGMECVKEMLSGGELSRVVLAYTLALAEIFNTPLILLDECTSSLDQEMTTTVFNGIRENFNGQLVLVIAHQVISGTFDKVLKL